VNAKPSKQLDYQALTERIRGLEEELVLLKRELSAEPPQLPKSAFQVLVVDVGGQRFGVPIAEIREVVAAAWCEPIPDSPPWVVGALRYGQEVVPVVDIATRMGFVTVEMQLSDVILIAERPALRGFWVRSVDRLLLVGPKHLKDPTPGLRHAGFVFATAALADGSQLPLLSLVLMGQPYAPTAAKGEVADA